MVTQTALIVIGHYKDEWHTLSPTQQADFLARVGNTVTLLGLTAVIGYQLTSAPGTFMQIWETDEASALEHAVANLNAMGYARYVDARWIVGARQIATESVAPQAKPGGASAQVAQISPRAKLRRVPKSARISSRK